MGIKKSAYTRFALSVVATVTLATLATAPAHADDTITVQDVIQWDGQDFDFQGYATCDGYGYATINGTLSQGEVTGTPGTPVPVGGQPTNVVHCDGRSHFWKMYVKPWKGEFHEGDAKATATMTHNNGMFLTKVNKTVRIEDASQCTDMC
ncbi:hypothetical protein [Streptomyces sp. 769]|uniref:hypothetical protein n=1 Tax=Streptomyces sp. 769 TaxID=1262452 RepID=UPI00057E6F77|nr:hypothetical protein [Streptomyces sp. 769]AJC60177.1 hypothetical protein GZL_07627 [Streptomyces sp. 769]